MNKIFTTLDVIVQGITNPPALFTATARAISEAKTYNGIKDEIKKLQEELEQEIQRSTQNGYKYEARFSTIDQTIIKLFNLLNQGQQAGKTTINTLFDFQQKNRVVMFQTMFPEELETILTDSLYGVESVPFSEEYQCDPKKMNLVKTKNGQTVVYPLDLGHLALMLKQIGRQEHKILTPTSISQAQCDALVNIYEKKDNAYQNKQKIITVSSSQKQVISVPESEYLPSRIYKEYEVKGIKRVKGRCEILGYIKVIEGSKLIIEPGTQLLFGKDAGIIVFESEINAEGTNSEKIFFDEQIVIQDGEEYKLREQVAQEQLISFRNSYIAKSQMAEDLQDNQLKQTAVVQ